MVYWYTNYTSWIESMKVMSNGLFMVATAIDGFFVYNSNTHATFQHMNLYVIDFENMKNNATNLVAFREDGIFVFDYANNQNMSFIPAVNLTTIRILSDANLVVGMSNGDIAIWNLTLKSQVEIFHTHQSKVNDLELLTSNIILSVSDDTTVKLWDIAINDCLATINPFNNPVKHLILMTNDMVAVGGDSNKVIVIKVNTDANTFSIVNTIFAPGLVVQSIVLNAQNILLISSYERLVLYDLDNSVYIDVLKVPIDSMTVNLIVNCGNK